MEAICKAAVIQKSKVPDEGELGLINAQSLRSLSADEVFTFCLEGCNTKIDRDFERFTDQALEQMAKLYVGKPVLRDHHWNNGSQTARVYAAGVDTDGEVKRLVLRCYMPRTEGTAETIAAIESGVIRECSVGVVAGTAICSVCGANQMDAMCLHNPGRKYDGKLCYFDLGDIRDAYEVSLVAVPAQREAGVIKSKRYGGAEPPKDDVTVPESGTTTASKALQQAKARLELEKIRYGG